MKRYIIVVLFVCVFVGTSYCQQMTIDDADITTYRSFQIESWYGSYESWLLPAVSPLPFLEISAGTSFNTYGTFRHNSWLFEGKFLSGDLEKKGRALSFVAGTLLQSDFNSVKNVYAYVPYSFLLFDSESVLHMNVGVFSDIDNGKWDVGALYGIRADVHVYDYIFILSELYTTDFELPGFQIGFRAVIIDELLEVDVTWGRGFEKGIEEPGLNIGVAYTPDKMW